jgi:hypothetical protein
MTGWTFMGFERRHGREIARFRHDDGDSRAIPLDAPTWLPVHDDEAPHADPAVHARVVRAARQFAALARTAHVVNRLDEARSPRPQRRGRTS